MMKFQEETQSQDKAEFWIKSNLRYNSGFDHERLRSTKKRESSRNRRHYSRKTS